MAFLPSFIDDVIARNPIEDVVGQYVALKRQGGNLFGLCPFHGEKTASFSVAPEKGIFYCFGCHKGGGVINFIMEIENLSYPDSVRYLAKRAGLEAPEDEQYQSRYRKQERLWSLSKEAARFFCGQLYAPAGAAGLAYAQKRRLSKNTLTKFGIGFAPNAWSSLLDAMKRKGYTEEELLEAGLAVKSAKGAVYDRFRNRLMFPIIDVRGNVIGFGGRVMDDSTPKYLNSPETLIFNKRKNLFALNLAKKSKQGRIILVEGYMDAIALHQFGFDCAVASLGTSLTEEHAALLSRYTDQVVLIYDGDAAGQNATQRAIPMLEKTGVQVKVLRMRGAKDPDEFLNKYGADRFKLLLEESENRVEYQLRAIERKYDLKSDEQRVRFLQEAAEFLATLSNAVQREVYGVRAAEAAGITYEAMKLEVQKAYKRRVNREKKKQEKIDLAPAAAQQPKPRSMHYANIRSAMAEEGVISMALREPALLDLAGNLPAAYFSSAFLGRVFQQLLLRHQQGLSVTLGALEDIAPEEASHLAAVAQKQQFPVSERAMQDCIATIRQEYAKSHADSSDALMALREKMRERKGYQP
ncbi:MAG: DNA primase [Oscillospiraceae bacterium]|nr:DNA primase [Oscillospiraceae bacterium]